MRKDASMECIGEKNYPLAVFFRILRSLTGKCDREMERSYVGGVMSWPLADKDLTVDRFPLYLRPFVSFMLTRNGSHKREKTRQLGGHSFLSSLPSFPCPVALSPSHERRQPTGR